MFIRETGDKGERIRKGNFVKEREKEEKPQIKTSSLRETNRNTTLRGKRVKR